MLTVNDDGVSIRLTGQGGDPLFWWSVGLLVLGIVVAVICFTMPVAYAIGSLFVFAVAMFGFNIKRHQAKRRHVFGVGELRLTPKRFMIDDKSLTLSESAQVDINGVWLIVKDRGIEYHFTGFAGEREMSIAKAVLDGQSIAKKNAVIKMVSTAD
ncbi:hypothetical protein [Moraxella pluranimalium]|uniref:Uncharacterized protein n=1 Tax=Moraxella pluranimalium TaxID=470453 RepID=A0A1T0CLW7_9GAMM|nr:hypothetical protein [Moraxella pluranimalium]OOS23348.1 hypothetical protein B0680_07160 [Moraxella pluranimalium]